MSAMCNSPRTDDESYETFIKVKYNPASSFCTVALHVTFFYSVTVVHVDATSIFFLSFSYVLQEKTAILESYRRKAKITTSMLNSLEGISCSDVTGALYAFAKIELPQKAIEEAKASTFNGL